MRRDGLRKSGIASYVLEVSGRRAIIRRNGPREWRVEISGKERECARAYFKSLSVARSNAIALLDPDSVFFESSGWKS